MLIQGDAARIPLPDKSVHCVVTSPPYFGLRRYQGEQGRGLFPNLGLEPTPKEHIQHIVEVFKELWRVLRDDGIVWLNYGDCYSGSGKGAANYPSDYPKQNSNTGSLSQVGINSYKGIEGGNLMLVPHRIAIALQDDGWIVRNDLVWWKRNPMPESVSGWSWQNGKLHKGSFRHTRAHEYIFQLVKKMNYYSNQEAVRENHQSTRWGGEIITQPPDTKYAEATDQGFAGAAESLSRPVREWNAYPTGGRNPRSVLDVPTSPYSGAHYATFPPDLIAPLIRASCPRRCCPECGQAWAPVVKKDFIKTSDGRANITGQDFMQGWEGIPRGNPNNQILDYRPTCSCGHEDYVPGIVLDPFVGSGTTVMAAKQLLRKGIGLDISMEYLDEQAKVRAKISSPSNQFENLPLFEVEDAS